MTKIDIISGFLGAGKTTLIKKLIADAFKGEQIVLIENEFGEIGIDGGFLKDAGIQITEMNSGCICCSLVGDFGTALREVIETHSPDRIIIEPSGVGKLSDVIKAVLNLHINDIVLNSTATVVDCTKAKMYMKNFGEFFNNQIESAGAIILSRTQLAKDGVVDDCVARIREHNSEAQIVTTPWDDIDGAVLLSAMEHTNSINSIMHELLEEHEHEHEHHHHEDHEHHEHHHHEHEHHHHDHECDCGHHHDHDHDHHDHDHHADEIFTSWGRETSKAYDKQALNDIVNSLVNSDTYGTVLRAKGIVPCEGSSVWLQFDATPGEYEIREGSADYTGKLCVIGTDLKEDDIENLFGLA